MNKVVVADDKDIIIGEIIVNEEKRQDLKDICKYLMERCFFVRKKNLAEPEDIFKSGLSVSKNGNSLLEKREKIGERFTIEGNLNVSYELNEYKNRYLGIILIFISLLDDELNVDNYDVILTKEFIMDGIFKKVPFEKLWPIFVNNAINSMKKNPNNGISDDYDIFKFALNENLISFNVKDSFTYGDSKYKSIFSKMTSGDLDTIVHSSEILNFKELNKNLKLKK